MSKISMAFIQVTLLLVGLPSALADCLKNDEEFASVIEDLRKITSCSVSNMAVCRDSLNLPAVGALTGAVGIKAKSGTPRKIQLKVPKSCTFSSHLALEEQTLIAILTDLLLPPAMALGGCPIQDLQPEVQKDFFKLLDAEASRLAKEATQLDGEVEKAMANGPARDYVTKVSGAYNTLIRSHSAYVEDLDALTKISEEIERKPFGVNHDDLLNKRNLITKRLDDYVTRNSPMRSQLEALRAMGKMRLAGASARVQSLVWRTQPGVIITDSNGAKMTAPQSLIDAESKAISNSRSLQALSEIRSSARNPFQKALTGAMEQFAMRLSPSLESFQQLFALRARIPTPVGTYSQIAAKARGFGARVVAEESIVGRAAKGAIDASRQLGSAMRQGAASAGKKLVLTGFGLPGVLLVVTEGFAATDTACQQPHETNGVYSPDASCKIMELGDIGHAIVGRPTEELVKSLNSASSERRSLCYAHGFYFPDDTQATCTKDGVNMRIPSRGIWASSTYDAKGNLTNLGIFTVSDRIDIKYLGDVPDSITDEVTVGDSTVSGTAPWSAFNGSPDYQGSKYQRFIPLAQARTEELRSCCSGYLKADDPACSPLKRGAGGKSGGGTGNADR